MPQQTETSEIKIGILTNNKEDITMSPEDFKNFIEDKIDELESTDDYDNYIMFLVDNINDTNSANKAVLVRLNGADTQVFYNSTDTFLKSKSKTECATKSDNGLMSSNDYALLKNLDYSLNIDSVNSLITNNSEILENIIEVDEDKTISNNNKIYKFKDKKISTIDDIKERLEKMEESIGIIEKFFDSDLLDYNKIDDLINEKVEEKIKDISNIYINHTHKYFN